MHAAFSLLHHHVVCVRVPGSAAHDQCVIIISLAIQCTLLQLLAILVSAEWRLATKLVKKLQHVC